jgi:hypothetical protein
VWPSHVQEVGVKRQLSTVDAQKKEIDKLRERVAWLEAALKVKEEQYTAKVANIKAQFLAAKLRADELEVRCTAAEQPQARRKRLNRKMIAKISTMLERIET